MRVARFWLTRIHRWTGLALVVFLVVVGFTGALLPFQNDIQQLLSPTPSELVIRAPASGGQPLDWPILRRIAEHESGGQIDLFPLHRGTNEPATFGVSATANKPPPAIDAISLDPFTGHVVARHRIGDNGPFVGRIMPFLYQLHTSLALGDWGSWLLGVAALAWTVDCFVGFCLTLPAIPHGRWRKWRHAWAMKTPSPSMFRLNIDIHRAFGLWLWPMLFVFAWSSVGMNLNGVSDPVMRFVFRYPPPPALADRPNRAPELDWDQALRAARINAAAEAKRLGITIKREREMRRNTGNATYAYAVRTSRDRSTDGANSWFTIDGDTGRVLLLELPTGQHTGETVGYWLGLLHTAAVFGLPYRIFVSVTGMAIIVLSITGIVVWAKKRKARAFRSRRKTPARQLTSARRVAE